MKNTATIIEAGKAFFMLNVPNQEIARILAVSENTVSAWVQKGAWREERNTTTANRKVRMEMLGDLIDYQLEALHQRMRNSRERAAATAEQERVFVAAKALYMLYIGSEEITEVLSIEESTLKDWIKLRGWQERRAAQGEDGLLLPLDKGEVDALAKMFAQVKGKELTFDLLVNVIRELNEFLNTRSPDLAKALVPYTTDFLMTKKETLV